MYEEFNAAGITNNQNRFRVKYRAIPVLKHKFTMVYRWRKCSVPRNLDPVTRRRWIVSLNLRQILR